MTLGDDRAVQATSVADELKYSRSAAVNSLPPDSASPEQGREAPSQAALPNRVRPASNYRPAAKAALPALPKVDSERAALPVNLPKQCQLASAI